jgi:hypothetical protein
MKSYIDIYENKIISMKDGEVDIKKKGDKIGMIDDTDKLDMELNKRVSKYELDYVYENNKAKQYCIFSDGDKDINYTYALKLEQSDKENNKNFVENLFKLDFKETVLKSLIQKIDTTYGMNDAEKLNVATEAFDENYSKYFDLRNILVDLINNCPDNFNYRNKENKSKILNKKKLKKYLSKFNKLNKNIMFNKGKIKDYDSNLADYMTSLKEKLNKTNKAENVTDRNKNIFIMTLLNKYIEENKIKCKINKECPINNNELIINYEKDDIDHVSYVMKEKIITECSGDCPDFLNIENKITVIGDLHGSLFNFIRTIFRLRKINVLNENFQLNTAKSIQTTKIRNKLVFLGDIIDSGYYSLEIYYIMILLKLINSEDVYIIRGNHEYISENEKILAPNAINQNDVQEDLDHKYITNIVFGGRLSFNLECADMNIEPELIFNSYRYLPCALFLQIDENGVDRYYFFSHGGISPYFTTNIFRPEDAYEHYIVSKKIMDDMMWSDFLHDLSQPDFYVGCTRTTIKDILDQLKNIQTDISLDSLEKIINKINNFSPEELSHIIQEEEEILESITTLIKSVDYKNKLDTTDLKNKNDNLEKLLNKAKNLTLVCKLSTEAEKNKFFEKINSMNNSEILELINQEWAQNKTPADETLTDIPSEKISLTRNLSTSLKTNDIFNEQNKIKEDIEDEINSLFLNSTEFNTYADQNKGVLLHYLPIYILVALNNIKFIFRGHQDKFVNTRLFNYNSSLEINDRYDKVLEFNGNIIKNLNASINKDILNNYRADCFDTDNKFVENGHNCKYPIVADFNNMAGTNYSDLQTYKDNPRLINKNSIINQFVKFNDTGNNKGRIEIPEFKELIKLYNLMAPLLTLSNAESKNVKNDSFVVITINKIEEEIEGGQRGAGTINSYKTKYLKYKNKYLKLKYNMN